MKKKNPNDPWLLRRIQLFLAAAVPASYCLFAIGAGRPIRTALLMAATASVALWFIWSPAVQTLPLLRQPLLSPKNLVLLRQTLAPVPWVVRLEYVLLIAFFILLPAAGLWHFDAILPTVGFLAVVLVAHKGVILFRPLFSTWPLRLLASLIVGVVGLMSHQIALRLVHDVTQLDPSLFTHTIVSLTSLVTAVLVWISVPFLLILASGARLATHHAAAQFGFLRPIVQVFFRRGPRITPPTLLDGVRWMLVCSIAYSFWIAAPTVALAAFAPTTTPHSSLASFIARLDGYSNAPCAGTSGARVVYTGGDSIVIARWSPEAGRYIFQRGVCQLATATQ